MSSASPQQEQTQTSGSAGQSNSNNKTEHISNPRRLLVLSPTPHSQNTIPPLLHALTGVPVSAPPQAESSADVAGAATKENKNTEDTTTPTTTTTTTFAGYTTHAPLRIHTKYYTAEIPIWVDEVPLPLPASSSRTTSSSSSSASPTPTPTPTPMQWKDEFLSSEARVVRDAIGAVVVCFQNPEPHSSSAIPRESLQQQEASPTSRESEREDVRALKGLLKMVGEVKGLIEEERGGLGEVPGVVVLVGKKREKQDNNNNKKKNGVGSGLDGLEEAEEPVEPFSTGWWEDELYEMGIMEFEVVAWDPRTDPEGKEERRNRFGEFEGMRRIREVLETHEWAASSSNDKEGHDDDDTFGLDSDGEEGEDGFALEVNELEREMMGLRMAIEKGFDDLDDDDDDDDKEMKVEGLESLMMRMQAIKDMSAELPEHERKAFAAKAVRDIMKEL
ncbi:hypothetical protein VTN00DRAFT_475 [Thermoascus crustaceus]|uniref:uncharacterized protein n=1 Tax=Thermoascus crustaceus TaxID=5088 RepID=UPI003742F0F7